MKLSLWMNLPARTEYLPGRVLSHVTHFVSSILNSHDPTTLCLVTTDTSALDDNPSLINRFGVISVNSALEVDIYGNANSTHVNGTRMLNGIGGSGDFIQNSPLSILALPSTLDGDETSRIVPMVPHVNHTEHNVDRIITERGIADLRGKSPRERARTVIDNCAHPSLRMKLDEYYQQALENGGHTPHDFSAAFNDL